MTALCSNRVAHAIHERATDACERCGVFGTDHIIRTRQILQPGHELQPNNGVLLCPACNGWTSWADDATHYGYDIPAWVDDPATVPIKMRAPGGAWRWFRLVGANKYLVRTDEAHRSMWTVGIVERLVVNA